MRKLILLSILLVFTTGFAVANHRFDFLEGKYGNYHYDLKVSVKSIKGGIKVKGIPGHRGWRKYYHSRNNVLKEKRGNHLLIINGRNRITIKNRRRGHGINLSRIGRNYGYDYQRDRRFYSSGDRYSSERYDRDYKYYEKTYPEERDSYKDDYLGNNNDLASIIVGEWYSNELRKLIIIEYDGTGIKARLSGDKNWTKFRAGNKGEFIDKKGNRYFLQDEDKLVWQDKSKRNKHILFRS